MRTAAPCSITARRRSSALSTRPAANSTASSVNPSAEPSSYPQIPRTRLSNEGEKFLEGCDGAFPADPQQADDALVDLVDQRQGFVTFGVLDFIPTDGADRFQRAMLQAPAAPILDS